MPAKDFCAVLGIGSAYGHEFRPILTKISGNITILEPAAGFRNNTLDGVALHCVMPRADGVLPFDDCRFDLSVCFSVLHHIPNVSKVMKEMYRCESKGGLVLLREPVFRWAIGAIPGQG